MTLETPKSARASARETMRQMNADSAYDTVLRMQGASKEQHASSNRARPITDAEVAYYTASLTAEFDSRDALFVIEDLLSNQNVALAHIAANLNAAAERDVAQAAVVASAGTVLDAAVDRLDQIAASVELTGGSVDQIAARMEVLNKRLRKGLGRIFGSLTAKHGPSPSAGAVNPAERDPPDGYWSSDPYKGARAGGRNIPTPTEEMPPALKRFSAELFAGGNPIARLHSVAGRPFSDTDPHAIEFPGGFGEVPAGKYALTDISPKSDYAKGYVVGVSGAEVGGDVSARYALGFFHGRKRLAIDAGLPEGDDAVRGSLTESYTPQAVVDFALGWAAGSRGLARDLDAYASSHWYATGYTGGAAEFNSAPADDGWTTPEGQEARFERLSQNPRWRGHFRNGYSGSARPAYGRGYLDGFEGVDWPRGETSSSYGVGYLHGQEDRSTEPVDNRGQRHGKTED